MLIYKKYMLVFVYFLFSGLAFSMPVVVENIMQFEIGRHCRVCICGDDSLSGCTCNFADIEAKQVLWLEDGKYLVILAATVNDEGDNLHKIIEYWHYIPQGQLVLKDFSRCDGMAKIFNPRDEMPLGQVEIDFRKKIKTALIQWFLNQKIIQRSTPKKSILFDWNRQAGLLAVVRHRDAYIFKVHLRSSL